MGQLKLFCVASDGRSLYGLSSGTNLDNGTKDPLLILVKSNPDPATLVQISWSVVSTVRISAIYDITQSQSRQVCAVDDKVDCIQSNAYCSSPTPRPRSAVKGRELTHLFLNLGRIHIPWAERYQGFFNSGCQGWSAIQSTVSIQQWRKQYRNRRMEDHRYSSNLQLARIYH
jgi:hypothetical protein